MNTDTLRRRVRLDLRDTGRDDSTSSRTFKDPEINKALTSARDRLFYNLRQQSIAATITTCRMASQANGTDGQPIPSNFWLLECGIRSGGAAFDPNGYVPYQPISFGGSLSGQDLDCIFAEGGFFKGTAAIAMYWKRPSSDLSAINTDYNDFPDGFYNTVATLAAIDLSKKTPATAAMGPFLQKLFVSQISTLV